MLSIPYEQLTVKGENALQKIGELRKNKDAIPIILGSEEGAELLAETFEFSEQTIEQIITDSQKITFPQWFKDRVSDDKEYYEEPRGDWPEIELPEMEISSHLNLLTGEPLETVLIAIIPTTHSWQVPAYLKTGGWNDCPVPEAHVALFKKWEYEYSSKVTCVTSDVIEMIVENPPTQKDKALELAVEQFIYCPDIVHQGVETIENLASTLLNGRAWYFWWD